MLSRLFSAARPSLQRLATRGFRSTRSQGKNPSEFNILKEVGEINISQHRKTLLWVVGGLFGAYIIKNSVLMTDAGLIYVVQNNLTGDFGQFRQRSIC